MKSIQVIHVQSSGNTLRDAWRSFQKLWISW